MTDSYGPATYILPFPDSWGTVHIRYHIHTPSGKKMRAELIWKLFFTFMSKLEADRNFSVYLKATGKLFDM